ncbi:Poly(A) polymerase pla1 [Sporodiniella umbellata]|nr:Poly(A) polymerase pla1 [Sporodiniella umbellata]
MLETDRQQWGITAPVSLAMSTKHELKLTDRLNTTLYSYKLFETAEESKQRIIVLKKLNSIVKEFVYKVSKLQGLSESEAKSAGGKIFTFGSYQLGVHGADADIDTLCIFPQHVTREHFFSIMFDILNETPEVTELTSVVEAYVPVIKMNFSGIPIDFVCAQLLLPSIPEDLDLSDDSLLVGLEEKYIRSVSGPRVTKEILNLVPDVPVFRESLRTIKLWAKQRGIYSNIMGFLGGVAWAMLVARVCQMYPNSCTASIVSRFFHIMSQWEWPQPVLLKPTEDGPVNVRQWNPEMYPADKSHRMPIITPGFPSMCATHNVTDSTRTIMVNEFVRAGEVVDRIMLGSGIWEDLFQPIDFFSMYNHYLQVTVSSKSYKTQIQWSGLVESRIRQLVLRLELLELLELAHSFMTGVEKTHYCLSEEEQWCIAHSCYSLVGRSFSTKGGQDKTQLEKIDLTAEQKNSMTPVYTTTFYIGLKFKPLTDPRVKRKVDLVWPKKEFIKLVKTWDKYDPKKMNIALNYVKPTKLPSELVFDQKFRTKKTQSNCSTSSPIATIDP